jgi:hypothetical protein
MSVYVSIVSFLIMTGFFLLVLTGHVPGFFEKKRKKKDKQ